MIASNQIGFTPSGSTFLRNVTTFAHCRGIGIQSNSNVIRDNTISGVDNGVTIGDDITAPDGYDSRVTSSSETSSEQTRRHAQSR